MGYTHIYTEYDKLSISRLGEFRIITGRPKKGEKSLRIDGADRTRSGYDRQLYRVSYTRHRS